MLEKYYPNLKKFVEALVSESENYVMSRYGYGEWACPAEECYNEPYGPGAVPKNISSALVCTAYLYLDIMQMKKIALVLGREMDVADYDRLSSKVKDAYNENFFDRNTCQYDKGTQSANTLSLAYGLVPKGYERKVAENINDDIIKRGYHLSTGSQGTKNIFEVLSNFGFEDTAYSVMLQKTSPSFGYMLDHGATSMWERWEADCDNNIMNSRNQPMFASCCTWFYKYVGGIRMAENARGFDSLEITPVIPSQLQFAREELRIISGVVKVHWQKIESGLKLDVELPFNTSAVIKIPLKFCKDTSAKLYESGIIINETKDDEGITGLERTGDCYKLHVGSGRYQFVVK